MVDQENQNKYGKEYALSFGKRPAEELYQVATDPGQINNLANDPSLADIKQQLRSQLETHLKNTGDPRIIGEDPWQAYIYHQTDGFGASYNRSLSREEIYRASLRPGN